MLLIANKRAHFDYQITEKIQAGIVLSGAEVKSLKLKMASLTGSFVQIIDGQAVLLNALITPYKFAANHDYDPRRTRHLLLHKKEIYHLAAKAQQKGYTLIPLSFSLVGKKIKLLIGLGLGKKQYQKRDQIKQRDLKREQKIFPS
jgi:SsrA-binding protein